MKKQSPLNYAFAIGKIRAREKFLIRNEVFEEAIESNLAEALKIFVESDFYSDELLRLRDSLHLEVILSEELQKVKDLIRGLILDKPLLCFIETDNLAQMQKQCPKIPSQFLQDYLMHLVDMHNIKTFLRLYILKEPSEKLEESLISGGFVQKQDYLERYQQDLSVFLSRLHYVHKHSEIISYASFLQDAVARLKDKSSFALLEKEINNFLMRVLKPAKYISFGPEPLLAYYFAKANEINLMRMVILAKLNNLPKDLVKERLNIVYA